MISPWTKQIDARLRELTEDGHTYPVVAGMLNAEFGTSFSKNACIGRGRRLKVGLRIAPKKIRKGQPPLLKPDRPFTSVFIDRPKPRPGEIGIEDLTSDTCHWPNGEGPPYSYCGKQVHAGGPYCHAHATVAYPALQRRTA